MSGAVRREIFSPSIKRKKRRTFFGLRRKNVKIFVAEKMAARHKEFFFSTFSCSCAARHNLRSFLAANSRTIFS